MEENRNKPKDYKNGKIYSVRNTVNDDIYIGSTTQPLSKRFYEHKKKKNDKKQNYFVYQKMAELGVDNFYIELIEDYPCENKEHLLKREGEWIRHLATLNQKVAGRTRSEYYTDCKDRILTQNKTYRENNKDNISEQRKQYREDNKDEIRKRDKEYKTQNYDKILESNRKRRRAKIMCQCGLSICYDSKAKHIKSKKHQEYLKSLQPEETPEIID